MPRRVVVGVRLLLVSDCRGADGSLSFQLGPCHRSTSLPSLCLKNVMGHGAHQEGPWFPPAVLVPAAGTVHHVCSVSLWSYLCSSQTTCQVSALVISSHILTDTEVWQPSLQASQFSGPSLDISHQNKDLLEVTVGQGTKRFCFLCISLTDCEEKHAVHDLLCLAAVQSMYYRRCVWLMFSW